MTSISQTCANDGGPTNWRKRLNTAVEDYCARNNASTEEAVESVTDFLRGALADRERLNRAELRHRTRNEIQFLIATMRHRRRSLGAGNGQSCDACIGQVMALANLNEVLDGDAPVLVDLAVQCGRLVASNRSACHQNIHVEVDAEPLLVRPKNARNVVLILNEALTNALSHAVRDHGGTIRVALARTSSSEAELSVSDNGRVSSTPSHRDSGGSLIDALATQIDARVHCVRTETGFRFSCTFPTD